MCKFTIPRSNSRPWYYIFIPRVNISITMRKICMGNISVLNTKCVI